MPVSRPKLPFFAAPVTPALYNNKIFYFPYWGLQGCTSQQVARVDICWPVNLHVGNILFYMIKMRKDHTERQKIQCMKDLQNIKFFEKKTGISSFSCASSRECGHFLLSSVSPNGFTVTVAQWMTTYIFLRITLRKKKLTLHHGPTRKEFRNLVYQLSWFSEATLVKTLNWNLRTER